MRYLNRFVLHFLLTGLVLSAQPALAAGPRIAVFDFAVGNSLQLQKTQRDNAGSETTRVRVSTETNLLTNLLVHELVQSGKVTVVERQQISRIMDEANLSKSELADPSQSMRLGKLLGADYLLLGAITQATSHVTLRDLPYDLGTERTRITYLAANARLVHTETGTVDVTARAEVSDSQPMSKRGMPTDISSRVQQNAYRLLAKKLAQDILASLH